jgi:hypothetical protein
MAHNAIKKTVNVILRKKGLTAGLAVYQIRNDRLLRKSGTPEMLPREENASNSE